MLQRDYEKALLITEGVYLLKLNPGGWYTFNQLYRVLSDNFGMSDRLVREGLRKGLVFQRRKAKRSSNQRGATPYEYRIPYLAELMVEFARDQTDTPADPITKSDLKSVKAYRLALHHQLCVRRWVDNGGQGVQMSREMLARRLGVSTRTTRTYDRILGHDHDANYEERPVTMNNFNLLPRYKDKYGPDGKKLPSKRWLRVYDYHKGTCRSLPNVRYLAYKALKAGFAVYQVERLTNTYYPYTRPNPAEYDMTEPVDYFVADMEARERAGLYQDHEGKWYYRRE